MTMTVLLSPSQNDLARELKHLGARVIRWPELIIDAPQDYSALDESIENLFGYDWLIVKSAAAAEYFLQRFERDHEIHELDKLKTLAIGEQAHQALSQLQIHVDVMANRSIEVFAAVESYVADVKGLNFLQISANISRESFELELADGGA